MALLQARRRNHVAFLSAQTATLGEKMPCDSGKSNIAIVNLPIISHLNLPNDIGTATAHSHPLPFYCF